MTSNRKIVLSKTADWDSWFSFVKTKATIGGIWELVDPSKPTIPSHQQLPVPPTFQAPTDPLEINQQACYLFEIQILEYKLQLEGYDRQQKAFSELIIFIHDTISVQNAVYIQKEDPNPWSMLRALKARLAPTDTVRSMDIEAKYHKLCKGPGSANREIEAWLDDWQATYTDAKFHNIAETVGHRPQRDFLLALGTKEPNFANIHLMNLNDVPDMYELIENFRQFRFFHINQTQQTKEYTHSASVANKSSADNSKPGSGQSSPPFNGQKSVTSPPKDCVCGSTHWYSECPYLIPRRRPVNWTPNAQQQARVDETMKNEHIRVNVDRVIQKQYPSNQSNQWDSHRRYHR